MRLIYLAGPYTDKDEQVVQRRIDKYASVVAHFMNTSENLYLFSPILQCFHVANQHNLPHDFAFWAQRDFFMIKKSAAMWVATFPGWQESYGVSQELEYAESIQKEVLYLVEDTGPLYHNYILTDARPVHTSPLII